MNVNVMVMTLVLFFTFEQISQAKPIEQMSEQTEDLKWKNNIGLRVGAVVSVRPSHSLKKNELGEGLLMQKVDEYHQGGVFIAYQPGLFGVQFTIASSSMSGSRGVYETEIVLTRDTYQFSLGAEFKPFGDKKFVPVVKAYAGPTYSEYEYELNFDGKMEAKDENSNFGAISGVQLAIPFARHFSATAGYELELERINLKKIDFKSAEIWNHVITMGGYYEF